MRKRMIWKYPLEVGANRIAMLAGAEILHVAMQQNKITLWAKCSPPSASDIREFLVTGTGWQFDDDGLKFVGTAITDGGSFVWHVFECQPTADSEVPK